MPKYETIAEFLDAAKSGEFTGRVIIDNDCVSAYQDDEKVFDFEGDGPDSALFSILKHLGINAEFA